MRAPQSVRQNPNATFVLVTAPLSALFGYLISLRWTAIPASAAAAAGSILSSVCLVFVDGLKRAAHGVWDLGIVGCWRRLWRGRQA